MKLNYTIVFVSDMQTSIAFYRDKLGLVSRFETSHWTEFDTGDATLALHMNDDAGVDGPPDQKAAGQCTPGFLVADLDAFHDRMLAKGVICIQQPREVFGSRIAQYQDPDGLTIGVSESRNG